MRGGALRRRAILQRIDLAEDSANGDTTAPTDIATVWAGITTSGGREFYEAKRLNPELTHQVELRYRTGIVAGMRLVVGDAVLRVIAPIDPDGRRRKLLVMCQELVEAGAQSP